MGPMAGVAWLFESSQHAASSERVSARARLRTVAPSAPRLSLSDCLSWNSILRAPIAAMPSLFPPSLPPSLCRTWYSGLVRKRNRQTRANAMAQRSRFLEQIEPHGARRAPHFMMLRFCSLCAAFAGPSSGKIGFLFIGSDK